MTAEEVKPKPDANICGKTNYNQLIEFTPVTDNDTVSSKLCLCWMDHLSRVLVHENVSAPGYFLMLSF